MMVNYCGYISQRIGSYSLLNVMTAVVIVNMATLKSHLKQIFIIFLFPDGKSSVHQVE